MRLNDIICLLTNLFHSTINWPMVKISNGWAEPTWLPPNTSRASQLCACHDMMTIGTLPAEGAIITNSNGRLNSKLKFWFFFFNTYSINMDSCKSCHYNFKIICCLIYPEYIILISLCNNFEIKFVRVFSIIFLNSIFVLLFIAFSLYYYHDSWDTFHIFQLPE